MNKIDKNAYTNAKAYLKAWLALEPYDGTTAVKVAFIDTEGNELSHDYEWYRHMLGAVKAAEAADKPFDYGGEAKDNWFKYARDATAKARLALKFAKLEKLKEARG